MDKKAKGKLSSFLFNYNKPILFFILTLWVLFTISAFRALTKPLETIQEAPVNKIKIHFNYDFSASELPEQIENLSGAVFTKAQEKMKVNADYIIEAEAPVTIDGSYVVSLNLLADGLWSKQIKTEKGSFNFKENNNKITVNDLIIDFKYFYDEIERISNDIIGTRAPKYSIEIDSNIDGKILYEDMSIPLNVNEKIHFILEAGKVIFEGDKYFTKTVPVNETVVISNDFSFMGMNMPLVNARYIFTIVSVILFSVLLFFIIKYVKKALHEITSEAAEINKKYKQRLTTVINKINTKGKTEVYIKSFGSLVRLSDEKDCNILKYEDTKNNEIIFYLLDANYVYLYKIKNITNSDITENNSTLEHCPEAETENLD